MTADMHLGKWDHQRIWGQVWKEATAGSKVSARKGQEDGEGEVSSWGNIRKMESGREVGRS
jgi:hypothetical protein